MAKTLLPTTLVGSYPQPDWLIDRDKLASSLPARVRSRGLWRVDQEWLNQAQDDATLLAIRDQERAGVDIITDGEMRRESYSNLFATALERALELAAPEDVVFAAGSLYLVGDLRRYWDARSKSNLHVAALRPVP